MTRTLPLLTLTLAALAPAVFGQTLLQGDLAPEPGMDAPECGQFVDADSLQQIQMLSAIQPLGDEIDPNDTAMAQQWAGEVTKACGSDRNRPLADAARAALGE